MFIQTTNPATGKALARYRIMHTQQIHEILDACYQDQQQWATLTTNERAVMLRNVAKLLRDNKKKYTTLMAQEMGKPITAGNAEIEKCALVCEYYAAETENMLQPQIIRTHFQKSYITYSPLGTIFGIMPWNFPMWQVFRFAAPNLMAGNACLLKHAEISSGTALEIEKIFQTAGLPNNVFRTLIIDNKQAEMVIAHPHVAAITLTGSKRAGISVGSTAAKYLKKVVLELGGNDPCLILENADLNQATETAVSARLANSGQVCIAPKRIIAVAAVFSEVEKLITEKIQRYQYGDPLEQTTQLGPLARSDLRATVHDQVQRTIRAGAQQIVGGTLPSSNGFYYPATFLSNVKPGMAAFEEEVFGPVVTLIRAKNEIEAIKLANQSEYGLGATIFTNNQTYAEEIATKKLNVGTCAINTAVKSDPKLPFGGIKNSGHGRELSFYGLKSFLNVKTIQIE
jgi:succinate-semialdehyde dehydrogenase/glutarate-semialdehyde dehydrogenase